MSDDQLDQMTLWAESLAEYTEYETEADQEALTAPTKGSERSSRQYAAAMGRRADEAAEQVQRWAIAATKKKRNPGPWLTPPRVPQPPHTRAAGVGSIPSYSEENIRSGFVWESPI